MVAAPFVPDVGHIIKLNFDPQAGHEQGGWRPALVLSPASYNAKSGLAVVVPITNQQKAYPFEVALNREKTTGVVLADAVKSVDWRVRNARYVEPASDQVMAGVRSRIAALLGLST